MCIELNLAGILIPHADKIDPSIAIVEFMVSRDERVEDNLGLDDCDDGIDRKV